MLPQHVLQNPRRDVPSKGFLHHLVVHVCISLNRGSHHEFGVSILYLKRISEAAESGPFLPNFLDECHVDEPRLSHFDAPCCPKHMLKQNMEAFDISGHVPRRRLEALVKTAFEPPREKLASWTGVCNFCGLSNVALFRVCCSF